MTDCTVTTVIQNLGYFTDFCAKYSPCYLFISSYNTQKLIGSTCCSSIMANCRLIKLAHMLVEGCYCIVLTLPHRR